MEYLLSSSNLGDPLRLLSSYPCLRAFWVTFGCSKGAEGEKDKDKGKKPLAKAKDAAKMKEVEAGNQEIDPKAKDAPRSQPSQKEDPSAKA